MKNSLAADYTNSGSASREVSSGTAFSFTGCLTPKGRNLSLVEPFDIIPDHSTSV
jgi:hypothetical protein